MPIAFDFDGLTVMGPAEFVPLEVEAATKGGALLREQFSKTTQTKYLANTCEDCGTFCGDFYLHDFWHEDPIASPVEVVLGCVECFTAVAITPAADGSVWTGMIPHQEEDPAHLLSSPPPPAPEKARPKSEPRPVRPVKPPPRTEKIAPIWGRCSECGTPACPATVNERKFFCSQCRSIRRFIPDSL
jgi:hypothetical protein